LPSISPSNTLKACSAVPIAKPPLADSDAWQPDSAQLGSMVLA